MAQHIHILGICGTFMGSLAQLAKAMGYNVTGSDANVYPPMSTQLENAGIELFSGFDPSTLTPKPDLVIVGNVISRGNPAMEYILNEGIAYTSGPQWLAEHLLHNKWVLAVAGTHGKTTTTSMLTWILEYAGYKPGYLVGGVPANFNVSARLGESDFFVIEADEYDTAFFDKRAKFVHYRPRTLIIGNMEFDHADIYPNLEAIQTQFHHLLRMLPQDGLLISPADDDAITATLKKGFWSQNQQTVIDVQCVNDDADWNAQLIQEDGSHFKVMLRGNQSADSMGEINWNLTGMHNVNNAMAAIAAARHVGVTPSTAAEALCKFKGVKRRMEPVAKHAGITLYDDFAHHPTAIKTTLDGLRKNIGNQRIVAVLEPRSNTMKMGVHNAKLNASVAAADTVYWYDASADPNLKALLHHPAQCRFAFKDFDELMSALKAEIIHSDTPTSVVVMSNGGFGGIHQILANLINEKKV